MTPTTFFAATDLVVVGTNPEMADYDNPRGEIIGHAAYVYADSAEGDRRRLFLKSAHFESEVLPSAERLAAALNARLANGRLPVGFDRWEEARPAYGSQAWQEYGEFDEMMLERREAEEECW